jgi:3-oxoacyl-[acyl-carrier protein] reductase
VFEELSQPDAAEFGGKMRKTDVDKGGIAMEHNRRFSGKIVIVTGGGSGLGKEIAIRFAQEEATVIIPDINFLSAQDTQKAITNYGGRSMALNVDVSQGEDVNEMAREVIAKFGMIHILVNNAGIGVRSPLLDTSEEDWDRILAVDLRGVYLCTKYVAPEIIKAGGGKIINISAVAGLLGCISPAYTAAKGGIISLTRVLAGEFAPYKINVNAVCPGFCATPLNENVRKSDIGEMIRQKIPWGRFGTPKDVAAAVLFLASEESDYITGAILPVDGGLSSFLDLGGDDYRAFDGKKAGSQP